MHYPKYIQRVIEVFRKLPGVGLRTGERYAFQMLDWPSEHVDEMIRALEEFQADLTQCRDCGVLIDEKGCPFCHAPHRSSQQLCVVASAKDIYALETTHEYRGLYHVLGALLSPLEGVGPEKLSLPQLKARIEQLNVQEVILALDSTVEGDATALFLRQELVESPVQVSRLAFGLPLGSSLEYVDGGTLAQALTGRQLF